MWPSSSFSVGAVSDIFAYSEIAKGYLPLIVLLNTLSEIAAIGFMFFLLLYMDYCFFGSRDHLRRHFAAYLMPFAFIAAVDILNVIAGVLYTVGDDQVLIPTVLYYIVEIVEDLYLIILTGAKLD